VTSPRRAPLSVLRRWPTIVLLALLGVGAAALALSLVTAQYAADAEVLVSPPQDRSTSAPDERLVASFAQVLGGRTTAADVVDDLALDRSTRSVDDALSARVVDGTTVLRVTARGTDADESARLAQAAATSFVAWLDDERTDLTASVVADAVAPVAPATPSRPRWLAVGGLLGLLAGLAVAALRQRADHSIRTPDDLELVTGAPVLGAIAHDRDADDTPLITSLGTHHPRFEAVRILRTNLQFVDIDRGHQVITVTSAVPGEGKSTTACNLAIALAQTGIRVALVEGDLRRPRVAEYLGLERSVGLTTVLVGRVTLEAGLQQAPTPGLDVLTSGTLPPNPSEILQTGAMSAVVADLREAYDVVLIDAPPLLPVTDAALLASISDGALLVVRHGDTGRDAVTGAVGRLQSVGARLLGTVLTMAPVKELTRYGYGYGYGPEYFARATGSRRSGGGARRSRSSRS
jgi:capsular exopolysaccharide synthesis family protein